MSEEKHKEYISNIIYLKALLRYERKIMTLLRFKWRSNVTVFSLTPVTKLRCQYESISDT